MALSHPSAANHLLCSRKACWSVSHTFFSIPVQVIYKRSRARLHHCQQQWQWYWTSSAD